MNLSGTIVFYDKVIQCRDDNPGQVERSKSSKNSKRGNGENGENLNFGEQMTRKKKLILVVTFKT